MKQKERNASGEVKENHYNYRMIAYPDEEGPDGVYLMIHSVYYDKNGEPEFIGSERAVGGHTPGELAEEIGRVAAALAKPVIHLAKFDPKGAREMMKAQEEARKRREALTKKGKAKR